MKIFRPIISLLIVSLLSFSAMADQAKLKTDTGSELNKELNNAKNSIPSLELYEPRADFLKEGYVYFEFSVKNFTILPLYTEVNDEDVTKLKPKIGHLHVMVDGSGWSWIHSSVAPVYFGPLTKGDHTIRV